MQKTANYELIYIARQDLSPVQVENQTEDYKKLVESHKGRVSKIEYWGLRKLAYDIRKNTRGHYTLMNIAAAPDVVKELERQMRINENILRYLTIAVDTLDDAPSAMMRNAKPRSHYEQPTIQVENDANER